MSDQSRSLNMLVISDFTLEVQKWEFLSICDKTSRKTTRNNMKFSSSSPSFICSYIDNMSRTAKPTYSCPYKAVSKTVIGLRRVLVCNVNCYCDITAFLISWSLCWCATCGVMLASSAATSVCITCRGMRVTFTRNAVSQEALRRHVWSLVACVTWLQTTAISPT